MLFGHLSSGYILACLLYRAGLCDGFMFWAVIITSVFLDFDYPLRHLHREILTHTPIFWLCLLPPFIIWKHELIVILFAVMLHLFIDTIDWGVMLLYPFSKKKYGIKLLPTVENLENKPKIYFFKIYLSNAKIMGLEIVIAGIAIICAFWFFSTLSWMMVVGFFILLIFSIYWLLADKWRKKFLAGIQGDDLLKPLVDTSLTTAVSMTALSGIVLTLLFGFMIGAQDERVAVFSEEIIWIMIISFLSTVSFIVASTCYHMVTYSIKERKIEQRIDMFRIGMFFYLLGVSLFLLTIILLVLIMMLYFQIGMPFIIKVGLFCILLALIILYFVGSSIFRFMKK